MIAWMALLDPLIFMPRLQGFLSDPGSVDPGTYQRLFITFICKNVDPKE